MEAIVCTTAEEVLALPLGIPFTAPEEVLRELALDVAHTEADAEYHDAQEADDGAA